MTGKSGFAAAQERARQLFDPPPSEAPVAPLPAPPSPSDRTATPGSQPVDAAASSGREVEIRRPVGPQASPVAIPRLLDPHPLTGLGPYPGRWTAWLALKGEELVYILSDDDGVGVGICAANGIGRTAPWPGVRLAGAVAQAAWEFLR